MKALANLSIRNKLVGIVLVSTLLSVVAGFALVIRNSQLNFQEDLLDDTHLIAQLFGEAVGSMVAFQDFDSAQDEIDGLKGLPWITDAYFYGVDGGLLVKYVGSDGLSPPAEIPEGEVTEHTADYAYSFRPISYEDPGTGEEELVGTFFVRSTKEAYKQRVRQMVIYMLLLMLAVVAAAVALAYLLQGVISNPILHLAAIAKRVSTAADYSARVEKPGNDEIGVLYDGFNTMLEQIQRRQEDLERSNRDLDQFAYVASHDLKAPLRAISTLSGWIEEDLHDKLSDEAREQMQLLRSRVERMDHLIEGILQYSRAGRLDSRGERTDIGKMLRELVELLSPPESFRVKIEPDMPTMVTKRLRLEQVFSNLITNAIKYHDRRDGEVEITARRQGRFYEFSVRDDGPGIAKEHHEKVFMMFQTLQPRDQVESTGLGLSLVKKLVEEEGGSIHLESAPGQGATFRFTWPAACGDQSLEDTQS